MENSFFFRGILVITTFVSIQRYDIDDKNIWMPSSSSTTIAREEAHSEAVIVDVA